MLHRLVSLLAATSICLAANIPVPGRGLSASEPYGVKGPRTFDDLKSIPAAPMLSEFTLRGGDTINGLSITLASGQRFAHGGAGGKPTHYTPHSGEYFISVKLCSGVKNGATRIVYAEAGTSLGNKIDAGTKTKDCKTISAPRDYGIVGSYGRVGEDVEQLGFYFARAKKAFPA